MFKRMSQLRQEGLQSLITSSISLITYSITHFLSSSVPYFFPCYFASSWKTVRDKSEFHPLRCIPLIAFYSGNKDRGKKGRKWESRTKQGRKEGQHGVVRVLIGWGCNGRILIWTMRPAHSPLPQLNWWQEQTVLSPHVVAQTAKLKSIYFSVRINALQCQMKGHYPIASPSLMHLAVTQFKAFSSITVSYKVRVIAQALHVMEKPKTEKKWKKQTSRGWRWEGRTAGQKGKGDEGKEIKRGMIRRQMGFEMLIWWASIISYTGGVGNKNARVEAHLSVTLC